MKKLIVICHFLLVLLLLGAKPAAAQTDKFLWPSLGHKINQYYYGYTHPGIDINNFLGMPIYAAADGIVELARWHGGYGNCVIIDHENGLETVYGHSSRLLVSEGQKVHRGQVIALVGSTGHSTGPHLHFEMRKDGYLVNPLNFLEAPTGDNFTAEQLREYGTSSFYKRSNENPTFTNGRESTLISSVDLNEGVTLISSTVVSGPTLLSSTTTQIKSRTKTTKSGRSKSKSIKTNAKTKSSKTGKTLKYSMKVDNKASKSSHRSRSSKNFSIAAWTEKNYFASLLPLVAKKYSQEIKAAVSVFPIVDPRIDISVIAIESALDQNATNASGASGAMQLMPVTAKSMGVKDVYNSAQNIMGGTKNLDKMYKLFGNWPDAILAYSQGERTARELLKSGYNSSRNEYYLIVQYLKSLIP